MKKIFTISVLLVTATLAASAQNEVLFKMKMLPDHQYSGNMKMNMDMDMQGLPQGANAGPGKMQMEMGMAMEMKTGAVNSKKEFPVSMSMQMSPSTMTINGKTTPVPAVTNSVMPTMYGRCTLDGLPHIDSIPGMHMNDSIKLAMNKMVENFQNAIKFPDKPMKVGDTFVQNMPFDMPMMGAGMKMDAKATYKLMSISAGKANFDVALNMDMDLTGKSTPAAMHMTATGNGKMEYDIAANYPTHYTQNMDMSMNIPGADGKNMAMKMKMLMDQQTTVK